MRWPLAIGIFAALVFINLIMDEGTISAIEVVISAVIGLAIAKADSKPGKKADWGSGDGMR